MKNSIAPFECILWMLAHPEAKAKEFCERWEKSRSTFFRMKKYCIERLWQYKVEMIEGEKNAYYKS